jgi:hypothetical protein
MSTRGQNAELVALRVGEYNPRLLPLSDIDTRRAQAEEALDFGVLIIGSEIDVQSVLHRRALRALKRRSTRPTTVRGHAQFSQSVFNGGSGDPMVTSSTPSRWASSAASSGALAITRLVGTST